MAKFSKLVNFILPSIKEIHHERLISFKWLHRMILDFIVSAWSLWYGDTYISMRRGRKTKRKVLFKVLPWLCIQWCNYRLGENKRFLVLFNTYYPKKSLKIVYIAVFFLPFHDHKHMRSFCHGMRPLYIYQIPFKCLEHSVQLSENQVRGYCCCLTCVWGKAKG